MLLSLVRDRSFPHLAPLSEFDIEGQYDWSVAAKYMMFLIRLYILTSSMAWTQPLGYGEE